MSRFLLLLFAGLVAFGTAFAVRGYVREGKSTLPDDKVNVLVAAESIPQGIFIRGGKHLRWAPWPKENLSEAFLAEGEKAAETFDGAVARRSIEKGEPITDSMLVTAKEGGFMAAVLEPGKRAVSIAVDPTTGNAGFISPGDRVDLLLTHRINTEQDESASQKNILASETFIENVRVLAVDQTVDNAEKTAILAKTVTLEVSKRQAEKINVAKDLGKISLSLRSLAADGDVPKAEEEQVTRDTDVSRVLIPGTAAALKVKVIRGGEREEIEFTKPLE